MIRCQSSRLSYFINLHNINKSLSTTSSQMSEKPVEDSIIKKLSGALSPIHLDVINESYMHNVPKGSETHFKVVVISEQFKNVSLIQRHRLINQLLESELNSGVHALSIIAKSPEQWDSTEKVKPSPKCLGGFGK